jgi:hypothetical protein
VNGKAKNSMKFFNPALVRHFRWLTKAKLPIAEKKSLWQNALAHFPGDHSKCSHPSSARQPLLTEEVTAVTVALADFINSTEYYFDVVDSRTQTQMNESLLGLKRRLARKRYAWRSSFALRLSFVVLHMNGPFRHFVRLVENRGIVLSERSRVEAVLDRARKSRVHPRVGRRLHYSLTRRPPSNGAEHVEPPILGSSTGERDDFSQLQPCDCDSSDSTSDIEDDFADDGTFLDMSGCRNERSCCHLNATLISLFSCQVICIFLRKSFPPHSSSNEFKAFYSAVTEEQSAASTMHL